MSPLAKLVEAALFASARPLTVEELETLDPQAGAAAVRGALAELRDAFATGDHGVELIEIAQGWQFLTRREYAEAIDRAQFTLRPRRLSPAALGEKDWGGRCCTAPRRSSWRSSASRTWMSCHGWKSCRWRSGRPRPPSPNDADAPATRPGALTAHTHSHSHTEGPR